jgi:hypothetical protein
MKREKKEQRTHHGGEPLTTTKNLTATDYNTRTRKEILQKQRLQKENNAQVLSSPNRRFWVFTLEKA